MKESLWMITLLRRSLEKGDIIWRETLRTDMTMTETGSPNSSPLPSCGLPEESELILVPPELSDVVPDPVEGEGLVPQPHVAGDLLTGGGEEAEGPQPVVDGDQDHATVHEVLRPVVPRGPGAGGEGSAVDPDHDRGGLSIVQDTVWSRDEQEM